MVTRRMIMRISNGYDTTEASVEPGDRNGDGFVTLASWTGRLSLSSLG